MNIVIITQLVTGAITAITAIIALCFTFMQIRISNKQHLYDKRVKIFLRCLEFIKLYEDSFNLMKEEDKNKLIEVTFLFNSLTNNTYLKDIEPLINDVKNEKIRVEFLTKIEEINQIANEIELLFFDKEVLILKRFIILYRELLQNIYKYQLIFNKIIENNIKNPQSYQILQKEYNEYIYREDLYKSYRDIKITYEKLRKRKVVNNMKKQIKLK